MGFKEGWFHQKVMINVRSQKITKAQQALLVLVSLSYSSYVISLSTICHQQAPHTKNVYNRIFFPKTTIAQISTYQSKYNILFSSTTENSEVGSTENAFEMDAESLGIYTEEDFNCLTEYEWEDSNTDPNAPDPNLEYIPKVEIDDEGIEVGWTPYFGSSNAVDTRTVISPIESYMIDPRTRKDSSADVEVVDDDDNVEKELNEQVQNVRKEMKRVDTYIDPWLQAPVPRYVAKWYGYPEQTSFPKKDFMNNRFTKPEDKTDFKVLSPFRARKKAIELARSTNNEWLPDGMSREHKLKRQAIYKEKKVLVGSLEKGDIDKDVEKRIQPALKILGSCVELLQISEGFENKLTVFRFHYKGAMKNRRGMAAWTETLIRDCGVECTGVVFETGGRGKDKYD